MFRKPHSRRRLGLVLVAAITAVGAFVVPATAEDPPESGCRNILGYDETKPPEGQVWPVAAYYGSIRITSEQSSGYQNVGDVIGVDEDGSADHAHTYQTAGEYLVADAPLEAAACPKSVQYVLEVYAPGTTTRVARVIGQPDADTASEIDFAWDVSEASLSDADYRSIKECADLVLKIEAGPQVVFDRSPDTGAVPHCVKDIIESPGRTWGG